MTKISNSANDSIIYAMMTVVCWSTAATAFKLSLAYVGYMALVFYASLVSMMVLAFLCGVNGKLAQLKSWQRKDYLRSVLLGILNPGLYYLILFRAYDLLPAQEALVLNFTWPVVLIILGVLFLRQQLDWPGTISLLMGFAGVVIVATHGNILSLKFSSTLGVTLALTSTLVWATYWVINQTERQDPLLRLFMNFVAGVIFLFVLMTFGDYWQTPSFLAGLGALYIGLIEMSLAYFCWFMALKQAQNLNIISNLIFLTPFFSLLIISQVLGEPINYSTIWGLLLIVGGIALQRLFSILRK